MNDSHPTVQMYRTSSCPFCIAAAEFFAERSIPVEEISLDADPDRRAATEKILPGHRTVPLILIGGKAIGGLDDLRALDSRGELERLLS